MSRSSENILSFGLTVTHEPQTESGVNQDHTHKHTHTCICCSCINNDKLGEDVIKIINDRLKA